MLRLSQGGKSEGMPVMPRTTIVRCDECAIEFELFKDLASVGRCTHGRPHRSVRLHRPRAS